MLERHEQNSLVFKIKKVLRYIKLFGFQRTLVKIISSLKISETGESINQSKTLSKKFNKSKNVGIIGCGNYAFSTAAYFINKFKKNSIYATYDPNGINSLRLAKFYGANQVFSSADELFDCPNIEKIFICSNHSTHAEYAVKAIKKGKSVHIEKPHVVNYQQLEELIQTMKNNPEIPVFLGFNRPRSILFKKLKKYLLLEQGPSFINWFIAGHELKSDHWYFSSKEGGRILGNICHWSDLSLRMVGIENVFPLKVKTIKCQKSSNDLLISYSFGDGSFASISFSAKKELFDGVRDRLTIHKGNLLADLKDFKELSISVGNKNKIHRTFFREQGHGDNIKNSLKNSSGESIEHTRVTGLLFLAAKESLDNGKTISIGGDF